jgi:hypothetical protein
LFLREGKREEKKEGDYSRRVDFFLEKEYIKRNQHIYFMHVYLTRTELKFGICIGPINERLKIKERHFTELYDDNGMPMGKQWFEFIAPDRIRFLPSAVEKKIDAKDKGSDIFCLFCFG